MTCMNDFQLPRNHELKREINRCEQSKTMHVAIYFSKLNVLWDEDKHEPLISCECGSVTRLLRLKMENNVLMIDFINFF